MPDADSRNKVVKERGKRLPGNTAIGVGGVDSYDLDATVDGRGSKGACHLYNKFNMKAPPNVFVAEYASRPPMAKIFYEDVLMAAVFYGYHIIFGSAEIRIIDLVFYLFVGISLCDIVYL